MEYKQVFETIDSLYEEYLKVWEEVCNIESPSRHKPGVDAVGRYFADMAEARGWKVERCAQEVSGDVYCITLNPDSDAKPISFSGHMDTVHEVGLFGTPAVHRDEEKIYGPGVEDCKGGIVAAMLALDALSRCGYSRRPVQLLLQSDEEVNSGPSKRATINYICEKAKDSVGFVNLEGHADGKGCLVRKGILTFTFKITGVEAHASNCATAGANAILDAAYKIIEMEKLKDDEGLTCNCGVIHGGTVVNTVPGYCEFKANVRFATAEQAAWVREYAQKVADTVHVPGCTATVNQPKGRPAMELCERNEAFFAKINEAFAACDMPLLGVGKRKGGSDAADVTVCGIPCVDSLGVEGGRIHSPDEWAYLESLRRAAKRVAAIALGV